MRELKEPLDVSVPSLGLHATLIERIDHGPMRTAADVSQKRAVGRYASQKNGRGQFWESRNELHAFYWAEVSTDVLSYRAQPHTLDLPVASKRRTYTPDRLDKLTRDRVEVVEVKDAYKPNRDPDYHEKLEVARLVYTHLGWTFRILNRDEIEAQPRYATVKYIQRFRRTVVTPGDEDAVIDFLGQSGFGQLAHVRALWPNPALGFAKMCALMIKRTIEIDFANGLSDGTPVRLVRDRGRYGG